MKTNVYTRQFVAICPNNGRAVTYTLTIHTDGVVIPVETIVAATDRLQKAFHEEIADELSSQFGGRQTLTAHHHGVDIETVR